MGNKSFKIPGVIFSAKRALTQEILQLSLSMVSMQQ